MNSHLPNQANPTGQDDVIPLIIKPRVSKHQVVFLSFTTSTITGFLPPPVFVRKGFIRNPRPHTFFLLIRGAQPASYVLREIFIQESILLG